METVGKRAREGVLQELEQSLLPTVQLGFPGLINVLAVILIEEDADVAEGRPHGIDLHLFDPLVRDRWNRSELRAAPRSPDDALLPGPLGELHLSPLPGTCHGSHP